MSINLISVNWICMNNCAAWEWNQVIKWNSCTFNKLSSFLDYIPFHLVVMSEKLFSMYYGIYGLLCAVIESLCYVDTAKTNPHKIEETWLPHTLAMRVAIHLNKLTLCSFIHMVQPFFIRHYRRRRIKTSEKQIIKQKINCWTLFRSEMKFKHSIFPSRSSVRPIFHLSNFFLFSATQFSEQNKVPLLTPNSK